jgi:hypothetical protein
MRRNGTEIRVTVRTSPGRIQIAFRVCHGSRVRLLVVNGGEVGNCTPTENLRRRRRPYSRPKENERVWGGLEGSTLECAAIARFARRTVQPRPLGAYSSKCISFQDWRCCRSRVHKVLPVQKSYRGSTEFRLLLGCARCPIEHNLDRWSPSRPCIWLIQFEVFRKLIDGSECGEDSTSEYFVGS